MCADAAAGLFAEAVAEDNEHKHHNESEALREDSCRKENGIEYSMGEDRSAEYPEPVDCRCNRVKADERVIVAHEDTEEEVSWH